MGEARFGWEGTARCRIDMVPPGDACIRLNHQYKRLAALASLFILLQYTGPSR